MLSDFLALCVATCQLMTHDTRFFSSFVQLVVSEFCHKLAAVVTHRRLA